VIIITFNFVLFIKPHFIIIFLILVKLQQAITYFIILGTGSTVLRKAMIFGVPYFKDISGFGPPPNNDTRKKRAQHEMNHYMMNPRPWSEKDKEKCFAAVSYQILISFFCDVNGKFSI
jgi:hypothetical protein